MLRKNMGIISYHNDDHSRFSGPEYLDRISLSQAYNHGISSRIGIGPKGYRRSDALIYEDVCENLLNDPMIDASEIEIEVDDGVVTLKGYVEDRTMKKETEICIEHIYGIEDIFNLLNLYQYKEVGAEGLIKKQARLES